MNIYPKPLFLKEKDCKYRFHTEVNAKIGAGIANENTMTIIEELWTGFTYGACKINLEKSTEIGEYDFVIGNEECDLDDEFEYSVNISDKGACVRANQGVGFIHGFITLLHRVTASCLTDGKETYFIKGVSVKDKPKMAFRAIHVCVFKTTPLSFVEKVIRLAGIFKLSHICLEFWGSLKYDAMAELAWKGAYTKEEIKPLVTLANALGLEIIPMFNHLGHAAGARDKYGKHVVLDQNPKKALLFEEDGWTWCIKNPDVTELLRKVRKELIDLCGDGKYFHIGCDEAFSFATCDICSKYERKELMIEYLNSIAQDLRTYGRRAIIWGDMLLDATVWDKDICASSTSEHRTHEAIDYIDKSIVIADWQYGVMESNAPTIQYFKEKGFDTLGSPWYDLKNIKALCETVKNIGAYGVFQTTWDNLNEKMEILLFCANESWSEESAYGKIGEGAIRTHTAGLLRKLIPARLDYAESGWMSVEVKN